MAVTESALDARADFARLTEPFRSEIRRQCYRLVGSLHEADDLTQETFLRAWRGFEGFDSAAPRAWLHRIATNACLNALERRSVQQRFLPAQRAEAVPDVPFELGPARDDVPWLEPLPDDGEGVASPESRFSAQESVQLAFVAALQALPARQRAAVALCDVLGWQMGEAAGLLETSVPAIQSTLQRARATLAQRYPEGRPATSLVPTAEQRVTLARYLDAWERHDLEAFVALLKDEVTFAMPPWPQWFVGAAQVRAFFAEAWKTCHGMQLRATRANGQPAFAVYAADDAGRYVAQSLQVLTLDGAEIAALTLFINPAPLLPAFGLPVALD